MRQLLSLFAIVALGIALPACRETVASVPASQPNGEFRVLVPSKPSTLNPNLELDEVALVIGNSLFNHLLTVNESGRLLPDLAESWSVSPDGLHYTFALRRGVRWHDGAAFTSADVKWTLTTAARDAFAGKDVLKPVERIDTPDPHTVVISLKHPWAPFVTDLAGPGLVMLPAHLYEGPDWRLHPANERPIGTGPFRFGRWLDDQTLLLEANGDYFRSGPYVRRLIFEAAPATTVADRLKSGTADHAVMRVSPELVQSAADVLVARKLPTSGRVYVAINLRRAPFGDVRVRRALAMAIERADIINEAIDGLGAPAIGWYSPRVEWAYNAAARVPAYDVEDARRLLNEAGLPARNGVRLRTSILVPDASHFREIAGILKRQFAEIGVSVAIESVSNRQWPNRIINQRDFDLTLVSGSQGPDPDQLRRRFLAGTESGAFIGYDDPEFREAVERGAGAVDLAARAAAYYRAQEILARDVPFIPLAESVKVVVHHRRVRGLPQLEASGLVGTFDFSLVKVAAASSASAR